MKVEVHFTHMDRSEALEQQALDKVEALMEEFMHRETAHAQIWFVSDHSRHHQRGIPEYRCEIDVRFPPRKDCFISKAGPDMNVVLHETLLTLKAKLRDGAKRELALARHG